MIKYYCHWVIGLEYLHTGMCCEMIINFVLNHEYGNLVVHLNITLEWFPDDLANSLLVYIETCLKLIQSHCDCIEEDRSIANSNVLYVNYLPENIVENWKIIGGYIMHINMRTWTIWKAQQLHIVKCGVN